MKHMEYYSFICNRAEKKESIILIFVSMQHNYYNIARNVIMFLLHLGHTIHSLYSSNGSRGIVGNLPVSILRGRTPHPIKMESQFESYFQMCFHNNFSSITCFVSWYQFRLQSHLISFQQ